MRYLFELLESFSQKKIVLMAGPRQSGKTTLARHWIQAHNGTYFNWDIPENRSEILTKDFMKNHPSGHIVLDEFHKYGRWKSWLKGLYDRNMPSLKTVVTGSARLDIFQRGGDSLLGRYELLHLHPYSLGEILRGTAAPPPVQWQSLGSNVQTSYRDLADIWDRLETFSGFPEPYNEKDPLQYRRWENRRRELLIREDLRELTQIRQLSLVEHLALLLPDRVGSTLSLNSLREELSVAHDTVRIWIQALERLYYCFRIPPYTKNISRGIKKEHKLYMWNWSQVQNSAARFENMVASHLLKSVHYWNDSGLGTFDLCYIRTKDKEEVDFVIVRDRKPIVLIEAKENELTPSPHFKTFANTLGANIEQIQLVRTKETDHQVSNTRIVTASKFFADLT